MLLSEAPLGPSSTNLVQEDNTSKLVNPYTRGNKFTRLPGATWVLSLTYSKIMPHEANWFDAFLSVQKGGATLTRVKDLSYTHKVGERKGSPLVKTNAVDGSTLETKGWTPSIAKQVVPGTRFSFVDAATGLEELHIVTSVANSDANGELTLSFTPELKRLPAANTALNFVDPGFSANLDKPSSGVARRELEATCSLVFREALYV